MSEFGHEPANVICFAQPADIHQLCETSSPNPDLCRRINNINTYTFMHIRDASFVISSPSIKECPAAGLDEFAFIGRSNVGKSSLINALVNKKNLAKTSGTPGKTKLINHFQVNTDEGSWMLVDLPGYGFAKVSASERKQWEKIIREFLQQRETLVNVFVLIDSRHSPQKIDLDFISKLGEWKIPFAIVFTKSDKETQRVVSANVNAFKDALKQRWASLPPVFVTSAEKRTGTDKVLGFIDEVVNRQEAKGKRQK